MQNLFPNLDLLALAWFILLTAGYEFASTRTRLHDQSIATYIQAQRELWMIRMSERESRIVDAQLLGWLVNANAFFASTSVITIGGLAALLGYGDKARVILEALPYAAATPAELYAVKVIFLMVIMVVAFFKFAWAFRLSHYTVIMMGATPEAATSDPEKRIDHARRTAQLLGLVGAHSNEGLRSFYYTIAAMMWFFHPIAFMISTTMIVAILIRRDFWSKSRDIIRG